MQVQKHLVFLISTFVYQQYDRRIKPILDLQDELEYFNTHLNSEGIL